MAIAFGGFTLKKYKEMPSVEGVAMYGELAYKNVSFMTFYNDGWGGGTFFSKIASKKADAIHDEALNAVSKLLDAYKLFDISDSMNDKLEKLICSLANVNDTVKHNRNRYVGIVVEEKVDYGFKYSSLAFFVASNPKALSKENMFKSKECNITSYVGIVPTFNLRGTIEIANNGVIE